MPAHRFQILALDIDGTLLDPDGTLRPRTLAAVTRAAQVGIRPVLCTGRRYRRAWPVAQQLKLDSPVVCNSGSIIKDPASHHTLWRADFDCTLVAEVVELFRSQGQPAVAFTDRSLEEPDFIIAAYPTGLDCFDDYVRQNHQHAEIDAHWRPAARHPPENTLTQHRCHTLFHICAIGTRSQMLEFQQA